MCVGWGRNFKKLAHEIVEAWQIQNLQAGDSRKSCSIRPKAEFFLGGSQSLFSWVLQLIG